MVQRVLVAGGLMLFGLVLALVAVEIGFRVINPPMVATEPWDDRPAFYYSAEGASTLRDRGYPEQKPTGVFRVAVVGDSFSFAPYLQFDDTFVKRLERMLNLNEVPLRAEVVNYGVPRYSTSHEVKLTREAIAHGADLVILQVTLNDPEIKPYWPTGLIEGELNRWGQMELKGGLYDWWRSYAFVRTRLYNRSTRERYVDYFFKLFEDPNTFGSFKKHFARIVRLTTKAEVPIVAVTFPLFGLPLDESYPFLPLHDAVANVAGEHQVPHLDLYPAFEGIPHDRMKVMPIRDFHPNEIAHRIAAEQIYLFLLQEGLLPEPLHIREVYPSRIGITKPEPLTTLPEAKNRAAR